MPCISAKVRFALSASENMMATRSAHFAVCFQASTPFFMPNLENSNKYAKWIRTIRERFLFIKSRTGSGKNHTRFYRNDLTEALLGCLGRLLNIFRACGVDLVVNWQARRTTKNLHVNQPLGDFQYFRMLTIIALCRVKILQNNLPINCFYFLV